MHPCIDVVRTGPAAERESDGQALCRYRAALGGRQAGGRVGALRRVALVVVTLPVAAACTPSGDDKPQLDVCSMASAGPVVTSVSADRWHAVLIAGDDNIPAFDNGVVSLRDKLAGLGVKNIRVLAADPDRAAGEGRAPLPNERRPLRGMGGVAAPAAAGTPARQVCGVLPPGGGGITPSP